MGQKAEVTAEEVPAGAGQELLLLTACCSSVGLPCWCGTGPCLQLLPDLLQLLRLLGLEGYHWEGRVWNLKAAHFIFLYSKHFPWEPFLASPVCIPRYSRVSKLAMKLVFPVSTLMTYMKIILTMGEELD